MSEYWALTYLSSSILEEDGENLTLKNLIDVLFPKCLNKLHFCFV